MLAVYRANACYSSIYLFSQYFLPLGVLLDDAVTICIEQLAEFLNLFLQLAAHVGVAHSDSSAHHFHDLCTALDVCSVGNSFLRAGKRFVLDELETPAVINKSVASDACSVVVGFCKSTIDDHQHTVCLDGILALAGMNRNVAVNDVARPPSTFPKGEGNSKAIQNVGTDIWIFAKLVVSTFLFAMCGWIG